ncbi:MAG: hypothetical protein M0Q51_07770 [Bacteroidales bacterium]|nr:hypothetical protein [Bacteroidales bacterium]
MKITAFIFFFGIFLYPAYTQNITASKPARLQVYASKQDGTQVMMTSEYLSVGYDQLKMTGQLMLNTLVTDDETLRNLLDSTLFDKITFSGMIPEGQFAFQSTLNTRFSTETDLFYGDQQSRVLIDFDVSNRNTSLANTFDINCTGSISLLNDLGITRDLGLDDKVSFQFFQNVQTKNY